MDSRASPITPTCFVVLPMLEGVVEGDVRAVPDTDEFVHVRGLGIGPGQQHRRERAGLTGECDRSRARHLRGAMERLIASCPVRRKPRDPGPSSRIPWRRMRVTRSRCSRRPASVSVNPSVGIRTLRTPISAHSSIASTHAWGRRAITARSTAPGTSLTFAQVRTPPQLESVAGDEVNGSAVPGALQRGEEASPSRVGTGGDPDQQHGLGMQEPLHGLCLGAVLALRHHRERARRGIDAEGDHHHAVVIIHGPRRSRSR